MSSFALSAIVVGVLATGATRIAPAAPWLEETFDNYSTGPLAGQGEWAGTSIGVDIVSTNTLAGLAAFCDADFPPILAPINPVVQRPVRAPDSGPHLFSFALRVDAPARSGRQASLTLGSRFSSAVSLEVEALQLVLRLNNDFFDCVPYTATWDIGPVPGGAPDLTTGTYHIFELVLDFGQADGPYDDVVSKISVDGQRVTHGYGCPFIALLEPIGYLTLRDGDSPDGDLPDAVFFDGIGGQPAVSEVARWALY
jgi:hypothetical protein